ncbi:MAG: DegV family protein [Chloroflexi bacterium]|nr:DegV family protein [Chloroflexota bacterium]
MNIKVVTDSTADLPKSVADALGITVVPAYVHFGKEVYRDRVDITEEQLYARLMNDSIHPSTEPPTPADFAHVYGELSQEADGILSVHVSSKLSATCHSALRGKELLQTGCPIAVIDSQLVTMGLGLLVKNAAIAARSGGTLDTIVAEVNSNIRNIHLLGLLDTLKYLARGGRVSKAKAWVGLALSVKPLLTMKNGEIEPAGRVRSRAAGINELYKFVKDRHNIREVAIVYGTSADEAQDLAAHLGSIFDKSKITLARLGPVLGVHAGPGILFVAVQEQA